MKSDRIPSDDAESASLRREMVERQIARRGIRDPRILSAMLQVPRHRFIPGVPLVEAYADHPVPIGEGQTISQPYMVALMLEHLDPQPTDRILEIGTGSGYQTALLAHLAGEVWSVERLPDLAVEAAQRLESMGTGTKVHVVAGDGTLGLPEQAPFDGIIVSAAAPRVPEPLMEQLADGGRLVIPVGGRGGQDLQVITRRGDDWIPRSEGGCVFVPLIGEHGWEA